MRTAQVPVDLLIDVREALFGLLRTAQGGGTEPWRLSRMHRTACDLEHYIGLPAPFGIDPLASAEYGQLTNDAPAPGQPEAPSDD